MYTSSTSNVFVYQGARDRRMAGVTSVYFAPDSTSVHALDPVSGAILRSAAFDTNGVFSDAQTRSVAAGRERLTDTLRFTLDQGATWTALAPPSGVSAIAIAVLVRE